MILASKENIEKYTRMGIYTKKTLMDYFKIHVNQFPDRICISDPPNKQDLLGTDPEKLTYKELDMAVDAVAEALVEKGLKKDDTVLVQMPNCWELAMLYLAVGRAGGIISPVPVLWRAAELSYVAGQLEAKFFITINEFNGFNHAAMAGEISRTHPFDLILYEELRSMAKQDIKGILDGIEVCSDDILTVCWTSGTEASPKGCPLSHNNWAGMAHLQDAAGMKSGDKMMTAGPLVNMASVGTILFPWAILGGSLLLHHPFDPGVYMKQIMGEKPDYTLMVPAIANMIAKHPNVDSFDLSSFRTITLGSASPSLWTLQTFKERWGIDIANIWGQNEGTGFMAGIEDIPDMAVRTDSFPHFGKPGTKFVSSAAGCVELKILDPSGLELTEPGSIGELVYKGPGLFAGYFKNEEMTKKSFSPDGFFRTGDLFMIKENNYLGFHERAKDIIIRGGYNISSQEVENHLLSNPDVVEVAVVAMPDEKLGERMCAYVVPKPGVTITLDALVKTLEEKGLAKYKHPERMEIIEKLPRNPVGKILKKQLRQDILNKL
ncbi:MAG: acyl--CoA ligase [Deltaproteobacteria bacterium]|nr:acyl--CoA ligase [Deltaproteobacteria bacterium]